MQLAVDLTKEYGIVLEGGGAKGAYQIGVWKAFREAGLKIKGIAGTSVGALNGAMMCMGDMEKAEHIWENISYSRVMDVDDTAMKRIFQGEAKVMDVVREAIAVVTEGGMDVAPLRALIDECVDEKVLQSSPIDFYVHTFNVDELKEVDADMKEVEPDMVKDLLLASAYIFPLFKNQKLHGKTYIDGGFIDNVPIGSLIRRGYEDIIVIRIFGIGMDKRVEIPEGTHVYSVEPRIDLGNIIDFDAEKSRRNMVAGYYDGLRFLYGLDGIIYYLDDDRDELYYMQQFASLYHGEGPLHRFMELEPARIALELKLTDWDYRKLYLAMVEATAKLCRVQKYKVYTVDELLRCIWTQKGVLLEERSSVPVFAQMILSSEGGQKEA